MPTPNPSTLGETKFMEKLETAIYVTMQNELDALQLGQVERNFAHSLTDEINHTIRKKTVRADPFYNKHGQLPKKLKGRKIELDIAVHRRYVDSQNLVAIEFETSNYPKGDDLWKLKALTEENGGYEYKLGLYVVFGVKKKAGQILKLHWYKNGRRVTDD